MAVKIRHKRSGGTITVFAALARALVRAGQHEYVTAEVKAETSAEPAPPAETDAEPKGKRGYRRRDMRAE